MADAGGTLVSGRTIARNVVWNVLAQAAPMLAAVACFPRLTSDLGASGFGMLALVWSLIGYFGLFDLGVGRALTQIVAERLAAAQSRITVARTVRMGLCLSAALGVVVGSVFVAVVPGRAAALLAIPAELAPDVARAAAAIALALPCVILSAALRGVLEGQHRFGVLGTIRAIVSIAMFAVPTLVTFWRHDLAALALSVALVRVTELCVLVAVSVRTFPEVFRAADIDGRAAGHLFRLGGWMTVSSVVGPVMMYFDRFVIAATVSAAAAAHYAAPYEVVTRLLVLPAALAGVLLPGFASRLRGSPASAAPLYGSGIRLAVLMVLLPVVAFVTLAPELLGLWLGPEFGEQGTLVLRLLSAGVLLNAGAQVPFALLHSVGRPDLTARLHLLELPFYLVILFPLITAFGIAGAAIAWMVRASVDALALFVIARRALPEVARMPAHGATLAALAAAGLAIGWSIEGLPAKIAFLAVYGAVSAAVAWWAILTPPERALARSPLKLLSGRSH